MNGLNEHYGLSENHFKECFGDLEKEEREKARRLIIAIEKVISGRAI